jgi:hypothetical protein
LKRIGRCLDRTVPQYLILCAVAMLYVERDLNLHYIIVENQGGMNLYLTK